MAVMKPFTSDWNFTPRFTEEGIGSWGPPTTEPDQIPQGQETGRGAPMFTCTPADGVSRFKLSSAARLLIVTWRWGALGIQVYVQFSRPLAGCHVAWPQVGSTVVSQSVDTSTPPTTP